MFRLTREVRFAVNEQPDEQARRKPTNSFGGYPSLTGAGQFLAMQVTIAGELEPRSSYVQNIKLIDALVREQAVPVIDHAVRTKRFGGGARVLAKLYESLREPWPGLTVQRLRLMLSPFMSLAVHAGELPMVRLSQRFEFSASHQLCNPALSEEENRKLFGKCCNPHGHGHNYEVQVTVAGEPDANGLVMSVPEFERIVSETVIERMDHRNLNVEVEQFRHLIPTVENIAKVIFDMLKGKFGKLKLAGVTVWETPKTWCEYSE